MAVSGSWDWTKTRNDIIKSALRHVGKLEQGQDLEQEDVTDVAEQLEDMMKELPNRGACLWSSERKQATLTASDEVTGTDGSTVFTCIQDHTSVAGDEPTDGANYSTRWIERGSTGGAWAVTTAYHNIGQFTPDAKARFITDPFIRRDNSDFPLEVISKAQYDAIGDKSTNAMPSCLMFDPLLTPEVYLWPIPTVTTDVIHYRAVITLQDFDAATNNPDALATWLNVLGWLLASEISSDYGLPLNDRIYIDRKAQEKFQRAKEATREVTTRTTVDSCYVN